MATSAPRSIAQPPSRATCPSHGPVPSQARPGHFSPSYPPPSPLLSTGEGPPQALAAARSQCSQGQLMPGAFIESRTNTKDPTAEDVFGSLAQIAGSGSLRVCFLPCWREVNFIESLNGRVWFVAIIVFTR